MQNQLSPEKLDAQIFNEPFNEALVHQVVTACLSNLRSGTKAQLSRAEVRGGGAKPWKQKGTGRARAGTSSSPIWTGGGKTFAAKTRDFSQKINKKMYQGAIRSVVSELIRQDRLKVVSDNSFDLESVKTKLFIDCLLKQQTNLNLDLGDFASKNQLRKLRKKVLLVKLEWDEQLWSSSRNIINMLFASVGQLNPVLLLNSDIILITESAMRKLEEDLGRGKFSSN